MLTVLFANKAPDDLTMYPTLSEYQIAMPQQILEGPVTLRVTNAGNLDHSLAIDGPGLAKRFETNLKPGDNRDLHVTLTPGTYAVYCPVANHREIGMALMLTVRAR